MKSLSLLLLLTFSTQTYGEVDMSVGKCGDKPNCVSSKDERSDFKVEPFKSDNPEILLNTLVEKIKNLPRVELIKFEEGKRAHFVFTTLIMRFKDDVYLEVNKKSGQVEVKSQSRVGYSDLGKNKERVESLRELLKS